MTRQFCWRAGQGSLDHRDRLNHRVGRLDHLEAIADRFSQGAADVEKIADAAKPLCAAFDASQKEKFGMLGRDMLMPERAVRHGVDASSLGRARRPRSRVVPRHWSRGSEDAAAASAAFSIFGGPRAQRLSVGRALRGFVHSRSLSTWSGRVLRCSQASRLCPRAFTIECIRLHYAELI